MTSFSPVAVDVSRFSRWSISSAHMDKDQVDDVFKDGPSASVTKISMSTFRNRWWNSAVGFLVTLQGREDDKADVMEYTVKRDSTDEDKWQIEWASWNVTITDKEIGRWKLSALWNTKEKCHTTVRVAALGFLFACAKAAYSSPLFSNRASWIRVGAYGVLAVICAIGTKVFNDERIRATYHVVRKVFEMVVLAQKTKNSSLVDLLEASFSDTTTYALHHFK